jgi:hypothetical protein
MQATTYSHNVGYGSAASGAKRPVVDWDELATKGICGSGAQYANDGLDSFSPREISPCAYASIAASTTARGKPGL